MVCAEGKARLEPEPQLGVELGLGLELELDRTPPSRLFVGFSFSPSVGWGFFRVFPHVNGVASGVKCS